MYTTKLFFILVSFDDGEWKRSAKFINNGPSKNAKEGKLFRHIYKNKRDLNSSRLTLNYVHKKLFRDINFKIVQNVIYKLQTQVEIFLINEELNDRNNRFLRNQLLAKRLRRKGVYNLYEEKLKEMRKILTEAPGLDLFHSLRSMEIAHMEYFSERYHPTYHQATSLDEARLQLKTFFKNLNIYYETEAFNSKELYKISASKENNSNEAGQLQEILTSMNILVRSKKHAHFLSLKKILLDKKFKLSSELEQVLLLRLLNFGFYYSRLGNLDILKDMAQLYHYGIESKILLHNGKLSERRFLNCIGVMAKANPNIDLSSFIYEMLSDVESPNPMMIKRFGFATYYFAVGNYGKALEELRYVDFDSNQILLMSKYHQIKICCLCSISKEHDNKESVLKTARIFHDRNRMALSESAYLGFINLVKTIDLSWRKVPIKEIEQFVDSCEYVSNLYWIKKELGKI